jgi:hypothetical protein
VPQLLVVRELTDERADLVEVDLTSGADRHLRTLPVAGVR